MKYKKKPVEIEAIQLTHENFHSLKMWINLGGGNASLSGGEISLHIHTLEGIMRADLGDFIIRGIKGEYYPCKPNIFEQTYEKV